MRLAADANVLLSALIGGAAKRVFLHPEVQEVVTAEPVLREVEEYVPRLAQQKGQEEMLLRATLASLPLTVLRPAEYRERRADAQRRMEARDPDDADLLAVALTLDIPIWSNDRDFEASGVTRYTTAQLLRKLEQK
ncbi:MAG: PIN domain-containing protein [Planctomycetes bacterium]|nr:PIN domain-containing protein [Planctomycetota bacterium]